MPWQPESHGRYFTTLSVCVSMTVMLLVSVFATSAAGAQDNRALVRYVDSVSNAAIAEKRTAGVSVGRGYPCGQTGRFVQQWTS